MEKIEIRIDVPDNVSIVAGPGPGRDAYKNSKHLIDIECVNVISFPVHVSRIIGSFFTGFFEELRKNMTPGEIREHFTFEESMQCYESAIQAFEKYIADNE